MPFASDYCRIYLFPHNCLRLPSSITLNDGRQKRYLLLGQCLEGYYKLNMDIDSRENSYEQVRLGRTYRYPANYRQALIHKNANKFGYSSPRMADGSGTPICPCCQNYVNTVEISLSYPTSPNRRPSPSEDVFILPANICLYFTFIKMVIGFMVTRFLLVDFYNLLTSFNGRYCALLAAKHSKLGQVCTTFFIDILSGYNKHANEDRDAMNTLAILSLIFVIISIVYLIWYQLDSYKLYYFLENNDLSQDDFTVLVENIPSIIFDSEHRTMEQSSFNYREFIKEAIENKIRLWVEKIHGKANKKELSRLPYLQNDFYENVISRKKPEKLRKLPIVHTITICYDLTELENLNRLRNTLLDEFIDKMNKKEEKPSQESLIEYIPNQIKILNSRYIDLCHLIGKDSHPSFTLSHFVGRAFVTFEYQHYRDYFLREFERNSNFLLFNSDKEARISRAPKPNDVFWHHMRISDSYRLKQMFYSYLIMFMSLILSLGAFVGLKLWRERLAENPFRKSLHQRMISVLFNLLMVAITNVINILLGMALQNLTEMQKHQSQTARVSSLILKNVIAKFLNTTVIYFIFHKMNPVDFMSGEGLVSRILGLTGFSAIIKIAMDLLQLQGYVVNVVNRWKFKSTKHINLFQLQLNERLQNQEFNLVNQYSYYLYMTYLISFYALLVPLSCPIIILVFGLQYWVDKYILFKKMSNPIDLGYQLTKLIIKCFECSLLVFTIGNLYWHGKINRKSSRFVNSINTLNVAISATYLLVSLFCPKYIKEAILGKVLKEKIYHHSYTYYEKALKFKKLYWKENPSSSFLKDFEGKSKPTPLRPVPKSSFRNISQESEEFVSETDFDRFLKLEKRETLISKCGDESNIHMGQSNADSEAEEAGGEEKSGEADEQLL